MNNTVIRKALREDCPQLMKLVRELAEYEKAPEEVTVSLAHFEQSGFGAHPVWWAYVAEIEGEICGFALYYIRYSTWKGQRLYLEDIYVKAEKRRLGIGKLLFDALLEETQKGEYSGMMWQVLDWNTPAINFYRKYGAKLDEEWVNCSLEFKTV